MVSRSVARGRNFANRSSFSTGGDSTVVSLPRQRNDDCCAATDFGFNADGAAMRFDDAADNGQTQAGALGFRGAQHGGEGALLQLGAHALAGVLEFDGNVRGRRVRVL